MSVLTVKNYISKRAIRSSVTWNNLNNAGVVSGDTIVEINGEQYRLRLLNCLSLSLTSLTHTSGYDLAIKNNSEWNRIMYRLSSNTYRESSNRKTSEVPFINLANYSESALRLDSRDGDGSASWCRDTIHSSIRVVRGFRGVSRILTDGLNNNSSSYGWRPVLEKVN